MESIGDVLKRNFGIAEKFEQTKRDTISDPLIKRIMEEFDLNEENVDPYLVELEAVKVSQLNCKACKGLSECSNQLEGHKKHVVRHNGSPVFINKPCNYLKVEEERKRQQGLIKSYYVPNELRDVTLNNVKIDKDRVEIVKHLIDYAKSVVPGQDGIGVYLYGNFGIGKTYLLWALVNHLSKRGISSIFLYVPDFVRELKNNDANEDIEKKIRAAKEVPVLVLDDIGAETLTARVRDEVIAAIIQHRVNAKLPTFYSSNKSLEQLKVFFSYTTTHEFQELQKAERIMQRIEHFSHVFRCKGENRRAEMNKSKLIRME